MPDPALSADTCIFMNDGNPWWLSPDIILNSGAMLDKADVGANNVQVVFHRQAGACPLPATTEAVLIELYIGDPSIAMTPLNTKLINGGAAAAPLPAAGTTHSEPITWTIPNNPVSPETPGHKCLVARCYPDPLTPSSSNFFVDDPHVAQRNICIIPCGGPGAATRPGDCTFTATTANVNPREPEEVRVLSWFDGRPNDHVRRIVMEHMRHVPSFKRLATQPPARFQQRLPEFPDAKVKDNTRLGCLGQLFGGKSERAYEVQVRLAPGQKTDVRFSADFSRAQYGDAHIFHLKQVGRDGRDQGGLTLVMVVG